MSNPLFPNADGNGDGYQYAALLDDDEETFKDEDNKDDEFDFLNLENDNKQNQDSEDPLEALIDELN